MESIQKKEAQVDTPCLSYARLARTILHGQGILSSTIPIPTFQARSSIAQVSLYGSNVELTTSLKSVLRYPLMTGTCPQMISIECSLGHQKGGVLFEHLLSLTSSHKRVRVKIK